MNWHQTAFALIDLQSFTNVWFWIALVAVWSVAGNRVFGVPFSVLQRAARNDDAAQKDLEVLVRIHARRIHRTGHRYGVWIIGCGCALLTGLGLIGFLYRVELAQAIFLLALPLSLSGAMDLVAAARIDRESPTGEALRKRMWRQRSRIQAIGMVATVTTVIWGLLIFPTGTFDG